MRGLGWGLLGFAEQLEFLATLPQAKQKHAAADLPLGRDLAGSLETMRKAAMAAADFCIENSCADGIPLWDSHAPNANRLGDYLSRPSDPYNSWEPVDSSAAAVLAQGLVRLGNYVRATDAKLGSHYRQAGLTIANALFDEPYLSTDGSHQGLLLHSVYHRPNCWDYVAPGQTIPNGESSMWGDYHARELALLLLREASGRKYLTFFGLMEGL
jgi:hypothetical protein